MAVTRQKGEGMTAFSVRRIQHDAWEEGAAAPRMEDGSEEPKNPNPYSDEAYR